MRLTHDRFIHELPVKYRPALLAESGGAKTLRAAESELTFSKHDAEAGTRRTILAACAMSPL